MHNEPNITRREIIKAAGAGVAAMTLPVAGPVLAADLKEKAMKNLKLGIFSSVYAELPLADAVRRIKDAGFKAVVCDFAFKDVRFDALNPDWGAVKKITGALEKSDIRVAGLSGYYNIIEADPAKRKPGEARMELLIKEWKRFGSPILSTESGTLSKQNEWADAPENHTDAGYAEFRKAIGKLVKAAEKTGAIIAIEAYYRHVIDTPERNERLYRDIPSPSLKLTMDPCNYFRNEDLPKMKPMLEEIFKRVGKQTVLAHAKDVKAAPDGPDLPAAGLGVLDYPLYLRRLAELNKELNLIVEHLKRDDVPRAAKFVREQMQGV
jgi:sugar phosphate isomerase/epimerase